MAQLRGKLGALQRRYAADQEYFYLTLALHDFERNRAAEYHRMVNTVIAGLWGFLPFDQPRSRRERPNMNDTGRATTSSSRGWNIDQLADLISRLDEVCPWRQYRDQVKVHFTDVLPAAGFDVFVADISYLGMLDPEQPKYILLTRRDTWQLMLDMARAMNQSVLPAIPTHDSQDLAAVFVYRAITEHQRKRQGSVE